MWSRTSRRGLESETSAPRERGPRQTGGEGWRSCVSHGLPTTVATACAPKPDHRPAATTPPPDRTGLLRRTAIEPVPLLTQELPRLMQTRVARVVGAGSVRFGRQRAGF